MASSSETSDSPPFYRSIPGETMRALKRKIQGYMVQARKVSNQKPTGETMPIYRSLKKSLGDDNFDGKYLTRYNDYRLYRTLTDLHCISDVVKQYLSCENQGRFLYGALFMLKTECREVLKMVEEELHLRVDSPPPWEELLELFKIEEEG